MDLGISGKTSLVCASSRGLGKACAIALAQNGVNLILNGRDEATLSATADEIAKSASGPISIETIPGDIGSDSVQDKIASLADQIDILVNNNGGPPPQAFSEITADDILSGVEKNMITPIQLIQKVISGMQQRKFGRIVNITSASVKMPIANLDVSSGARAGLTAFLAAYARQVSADNVTINGLLPGAFDTDRLRGTMEKVSQTSGKPVEDVAAARAGNIPSKRFGYPDEFGQTCAFLCSAHAGYITGQNILIDGGMFNASI